MTTWADKRKKKKQNVEPRFCKECGEEISRYSNAKGLLSPKDYRRRIYCGVVCMGKARSKIKPNRQTGGRGVESDSETRTLLYKSILSSKWS